jgi:hypothetical protein
VVIAIDLTLGDAVDHHGFVTLTDLVADGGWLEMSRASRRRTFFVSDLFYIGSCGWNLTLLLSFTCADCSPRSFAQITCAYHLRRRRCWPNPIFLASCERATA